MATPHHHNISGSTSISTGQADEAVLGPLCYQLSESTSLLLSSGFSADVLVDLFHFWEFSDSSDEDLFCLLHFARLFLNHTCVTEREHTLNVNLCGDWCWARPQLSHTWQCLILIRFLFLIYCFQWIIITITMIMMMMMIVLLLLLLLLLFCFCFEAVLLAAHCR